MAYGIKETVPVSTGRTDAKLLRPDTRLNFGASYANGALLLVEPGHPDRPLTGVPANGATIPNIAWKEASALLGTSGSDAEKQAAVDSVFVDLHQAADAMFERTALGGLHGIYSQTNNSNASRGAYVKPATALLAYLATNKAHNFYLSVWTRRTRVALTTAVRMSAIHQLNTAANYAEVMDGTGNVGHASLGSSLSNGANNLGLSRRSIGFADFQTTGSITDGSSIQAFLMMWGNPISAYTPYENNAASDVLYSIYLEDLTVSGRTFAQADAADADEFTRLTSVGGDYYDDNFTDPATFP